MWDERYGQAGYAYGAAPNEFLTEQVAKIPKGRVLDLAAGEGRNGVWLAEQGYEVTCVDQSAVGLEKAKQLARERGVTIETEVANLGDYDVAEGAYQGIVLVWCHLPPALRARVHAACASGLAATGVVVLTAYTPAQLAFGTGGPPDAAMCMTLTQLEQELAGLDFEVGVERERVIHEGRYHDGRSAVVEVVARRP